jgi:hypothetical protein
MLSAAVVGTCFIASIGTLIAHAVDAFRDRLPRQVDGIVEGARPRTSGGPAQGGHNAENNFCSPNAPIKRWARLTR